MSQILTAVHRRARGRSTAEYEDLDEQAADSLPSIGSISRQLEDSYGNHIAGADDMEMTSVSVVPDDTFTVTQAVNAFGFGRFQVKLSLFTGLCWMADSMEMTILSILSPALHCDWHITRYQQALTTTVVFLGMMLSSTFWGNLSDRYGRKQALTLCAVLLFCYGLLSSLAPNYLWILFLRGLVGFAIGCVPQSVTLYAEFLPTKQRAKCVVLLDCFWALGACFEVLLALIIMPSLGWQWLLALSTIPLLAFALITPWLPESARFHVASGQPDEALATLQRVAKENGKPMLLGRLVVDDSASLAPRGRVTHLIRPELRKTSLLLWFIWTVCAFCYYGIVLMTTELFETSCVDQSSNESDLECAADCKELSTRDYVDLLWTTIAEFPGIFATIIVIERYGRKNTMAVQFIIFTICICFLFICTDNRLFLTFMLFVARGIIAGVFQAAYVYTPEVGLLVKDAVYSARRMLYARARRCVAAYGVLGVTEVIQRSLRVAFCAVCGWRSDLHPHTAQKATRRLRWITSVTPRTPYAATHLRAPEDEHVYPTPLRAVGVGTCSAMARLGAMVTPYVAQVLMQSSIAFATAVYGLAALLAAVACCFLPIETKDREMVETVAQSS